MSCVLYCTVVMCCYIAARVPFEGIRPLIIAEQARSFRKVIVGGGFNFGGDSLACQLYFEELVCLLC